jgi:predicted dinucleotide-binding enzyme
MSASRSFSVGTIGAGNVAQAIAAHAVAAGYQITLSNSRGPESLAELVDRLGPNASAGTVAEAAQADLVILAVGWDQVPKAVQGLPDWDGRVVIDATNQWHAGPGTEVDLGDQTGSERNAALMPGARVVKAFNTLYARVTAQSPRRADGSLVVFLAGDDADAKATVSTFADSLGFAPVDLGGLRAGRLMQVGGGPLSGLQVVKVA